MSKMSQNVWLGVSYPELDASTQKLLCALRLWENFMIFSFPLTSHAQLERI